MEDGNRYVELKARDNSRERRAIRLQEHAGKPGAGVFPVMERDATAEATDVLRFIARFGCVPDNSPYWKNGRFAPGDLPNDVAVAFGLPAGTSFEVAAERAEMLLDLPPEKQKLAMAQMAKRIAACQGGVE